MRMVHGLAMLALFVALTAGAAAQTQITTASIEGIVIDASGGVLPGVDVEVRNIDTNVTRMLQTDRDGRFAALQLQPGRYTRHVHACPASRRSCRTTSTSASASRSGCHPR